MSFPAILADPAAVRALVPDASPEELLAGADRANFKLYESESDAVAAIAATIESSRANAVTPEERTREARASIADLRRAGRITRG